MNRIWFVRHKTPFKVYIVYTTDNCRQCCQLYGPAYCISVLIADAQKPPINVHGDASSMARNLLPILPYLCMRRECEYEQIRLGLRCSLMRQISQYLAHEIMRGSRKFCQRDPTLFYTGKEDPNSTKGGPSSARQKMAFRGRPNIYLLGTL